MLHPCRLHLLSLCGWSTILTHSWLDTVLDHTSWEIAWSMPGFDASTVFLHYLLSPPATSSESFLPHKASSPIIVICVCACVPCCVCVHAFHWLPFDWLAWAWWAGLFTWSRATYSWLHHCWLLPTTSSSINSQYLLGEWCSLVITFLSNIQWWMA